MNKVEKTIIEEIIESNTHELFRQIQDKFNITDGDISPELVYNLDNIKEQLHELLFTYIGQSDRKFTSIRSVIYNVLEMNHYSKNDISFDDINLIDMLDTFCTLGQPITDYDFSHIEESWNMNGFQPQNIMDYMELSGDQQHIDNINTWFNTILHNTL